MHDGGMQRIRDGQHVDPPSPGAGRQTGSHRKAREDILRMTESVVRGRLGDNAAFFLEGPSSPIDSGARVAP
jgi:hypothetical protein